MKNFAYVLACAAMALAVVGCDDDDDNNDDEISNIPFAYTGDAGPQFWELLDPANASCADETGQSPIDITGALADASLGNLTLTIEATDLIVANNGHNLEVPYETGSFLTVDGIGYELQQFHFHTLSEHVINGEHTDLEMHAVFKANDSGKLVVVSQLFNLGANNDFIATLTGDLPMMAGEETEREGTINWADGIGDTDSYFRYEGSTTTPPCSTDVLWLILTNIESIGAEQYQEFRSIIGNNFRPLQATASREILMTTPTE